MNAEPFQQLLPPTVVSWIETFTVLTPEPPSDDVPVSDPVQPAALYAAAVGKVTAAVGAVLSFTNVSVVVAVLAATSEPTTPSVGELEVLADQAKLLVVTYGPPAGVETVCVVCVQPVVVPPSAGNCAEAGPGAAVGDGVLELEVPCRGCRGSRGSSR